MTNTGVLPCRLILAGHRRGLTPQMPTSLLYTAGAEARRLHMMAVGCEAHHFRGSAGWVATVVSMFNSCSVVGPAAGAGQPSPASASHRSNCVSSALTIVPKSMLFCRRQPLAAAQQSDQQSARALYVRNGFCVPLSTLQTSDAVTAAICESIMRTMRCDCNFSTHCCQTGGMSTATGNQHTAGQHTCILALSLCPRCQHTCSNPVAGSLVRPLVRISGRRLAIVLLVIAAAPHCHVHMSSNTAPHVHP
jgi:hypothetical protein